MVLVLVSKNQPDRYNPEAILASYMYLHGKGRDLT
jgi:hypothetical protein